MLAPTDLCGGFALARAVFVLLVLSGLSPAAAAQVADSTQTEPAGRQCWTRREPRVESEYESRWAGKERNHSFTYTASAFTLTVTTGDGKSFSNTVSWSSPPPVICKGQEIEVSITASGEEGAAHAHGGFKGLGTMVASMRGWLKQRSGKLTFTTAPVVEASGGSWVGTGEIPYAHVRVVWEYEEGSGSGVGGGGSTPPGRATSYCDADRDRAAEVSLRARLANMYLGQLRENIRKLDQEWLNTRDGATFNSLIDVLFLATPSFSQTPQGQVIESVVKGIVKEGVKQYARVCGNEGVTAAEALSILLEKGYKSAEKRAIEALLTGYVTERLVAQVVATGDMQRLLAETRGVGGVGVDDRLPAGTPNLEKHLRESFVKPWVKFVSVGIGLESVITGAWTEHGKLESIREVLRYWRDEEIEAARNFEGLVQDLDVARYSYEYCLKLHPGERERGALKRVEPESPRAPALPIRKASETAPVVSAGLLNLSMRDGEWILQRVPPGSIYEVHGLVAGASLISIDDQPVKGLSAEQLKARLKPTAGEMIVLGFLLPDGKGVHVPLY